MMTILYEVRDNLYINLTNRCPCACTFCLRQTRDHMDSSGSLWLDREPTAAEVIDQLKQRDMNKYTEIVFCGFGEPTQALSVLLEVASFIKVHHPNPIRINTNGQGSLIHGKDITPLFKGLIDTMSISLNTPDEDAYDRIVRSKFGKAAYKAMLDFAKNSTKYIPNVILTTVSTTITKAEEARCQEICDHLGVTYRIREYDT